MKRKIITCRVVRDTHWCEHELTMDFIENGIHYFELPRQDLRTWRHARVEITIKEIDDGP